jgi:hypothetical protein
VSALRVGDVDRARELVEQSLEVGRRTGRPRLEAINLGVLGDVEYRQGNRDQGVAMLVESAEIAHDIGFIWWEGVQLGIASEYAMELGRLDDAERWGRSCLATLNRAGDRQNTVYALALLAWHAAATGEARRGGVLWGAIEAEEARGPIGAWAGERDLYERRVNAAAAGPAFEEGRRAGRGLSFQQAVEFALADPESGGTI